MTKLFYGYKLKDAAQPWNTGDKGGPYHHHFLKWWLTGDPDYHKQSTQEFFNESPQRTFVHRYDECPFCILTTEPTELPTFFISVAASEVSTKFDDSVLLSMKNEIKFDVTDGQAQHLAEFIEQFGIEVADHGWFMANV